MSASKAEQMPDALEVALGSIAVTIGRNSALPEKIPAGGLIILRDGAPGQALGGFGDVCYKNEVEI